MIQEGIIVQIERIEKQRLRGCRPFSTRVPPRANPLFKAPTGPAEQGGDQGPP
jgi:Uncharacterized small protein (DUF2292)